MIPATSLRPCVRRARAGDAHAIAGLINRAYQVERFITDDDRTDLQQVRRLQEQGDFLVLDREGGDLAAAVYVEMSQRRGHLTMLSVAPDLQGGGLGRRLVAVAEALCAAEGCVAMDLEVIDLRAELPPWYQSLGYHASGTAPFPGAARRPCRMIRMSKPLP